jgi:lipoate-protein ligase A
LSLAIEGKNDGVTNMARDIALLSLAEGGLVGARVYFWDSIWVTLGRNQKPEDALLDLSLNHIVRPTGGAAVLHGHDLTIGFAMPLAELGCSSREVKKAYLGLVAPLLSALNSVGIPASLGRDIADRASIASPYCFAMKSDYDVLNRDTGAKICGCAMRVTERGALLQASIPISEPNCDPANLLHNYLPTPISAISPERFADALRRTLFSS